MLSKELKEHGYYKKKGMVEKLASKYVAQIGMLDSGDVLQVGCITTQNTREVVMQLVVAEQSGFLKFMKLACERMAQSAMLDFGDVCRWALRLPPWLQGLPSMPVISCTRACTQSFHNSLQSSLSHFKCVPKTRGMGPHGTDSKCYVLFSVNAGRPGTAGDSAASARRDCAGGQGRVRGSARRAC